MTAESALIVPVAEAEPVVAELRKRFDPAAPTGVPAHITVLYPFIAPEDLDESIVAELEATFASVDQFRFVLSGVARFPDAVYLAPDPADRFSRLTAAIATRWPTNPPDGGVYDTIIPHLTVAQTSDDKVAAEIRRIIEPALPVACTGSEAWLLTGSNDRWAFRRRFPFTGELP